MTIRAAPTIPQGPLDDKDMVIYLVLWDLYYVDHAARARRFRVWTGVWSNLFCLNGDLAFPCSGEALRA